MSYNPENSNQSRRWFLKAFGGTALIGRLNVLGADLNQNVPTEIVDKPGLDRSYHDITIPSDQIERVVNTLSDLVNEPYSGFFDDYEEDDLGLRDFDLEEARSVKTVLDVIRFIQVQGKDHLVDYYDILDTVGNFEEDNLDECLFREYLVDTYGINPKEFPVRS